MNNIFDFAPKELVQDAVLCWCFNFDKTNNILEKNFSHNLAQEIYNYCGGTKKLSIKKIIPLTQQRASKIDVLVEILLADDKKIYLIFENKLDTSHHSNQLVRHIEAMKGEDESEKKYIYFKIGNLYDEDKNLPKEYILIDRKAILSIFDKIKIKNEIFDSYYNFLLNIEEKDNLEMKLIDENRQLTKAELEVIFWSQSGQYKILKKLQNEIESKIAIGTSFGRPWTNISILSIENIPNHWFGVFWRVDWRINKNTKTYTPYICLRYYKTTLDKTEEDDRYFEGMRKIFNELILKYPNLEFGQVHSVGNKEREVGILFFDNEKNTIPNIISEIGKLTKDFLQRVKDEKMYYSDAKYCMNID